MSDKTIYIIRHGQTDYNLKGIVQGGGVDTSLNETGRKQAVAFFNMYGHLPFEKVLTSTLKRTHETVAPFLEKGLDWEQHSEIVEMGWGEHEGKASTAESRAEYQAVAQAWKQGNYHVALAGGETAFELGQRLDKFVAHLKQRKEKLLLVCAHGRTMRGLMCVLKGLPLSQMDQFGHNNTGLWLTEQRDEQFHFLKENDTEHLLVRTENGIQSLR